MSLRSLCTKTYFNGGANRFRVTLKCKFKNKDLGFWTFHVYNENVAQELQIVLP